MFHDAATDLEVGKHLERVDGAGGSVASGLDEVAHLGDKGASPSGFAFAKAVRFVMVDFFFIA